VVVLVVAKGRPDNGQRDQLRRAVVLLANIEWIGVGGCVCVCFAPFAVAIMRLRFCGVLVLNYYNETTNERTAALVADTTLLNQ